MEDPHQVIEVDAERLPANHEFSPESERKAVRERRKRALGPVLAGLAIDLVDFATIGPLQRIVGLPLGTVLGWQMFRYFRLPTQFRMGFAIACGLYCGLLPTNFLPFATILGALARVIWPERSSSD